MQGHAWIYNRAEQLANPLLVPTSRMWTAFSLSFICSLPFVVQIRGLAFLGEICRRGVIRSPHERNVDANKGYSIISLD